MTSSPSPEPPCFSTLPTPHELVITVLDCFGLHCWSPGKHLENSTATNGAYQDGHSQAIYCWRADPPNATVSSAMGRTASHGTERSKLTLHQIRSISRCRHPHRRGRLPRRLPAIPSQPNAGERACPEELGTAQLLRLRGTKRRRHIKRRWLVDGKKVWGRCTMRRQRTSSSTNRDDYE